MSPSTRNNHSRKNLKWPHPKPKGWRSYEQWFRIGEANQYAENEQTTDTLKDLNVGPEMQIEESNIPS